MSDSGRFDPDLFQNTVPRPIWTWYSSLVKKRVGVTEVLFAACIDPCHEPETFRLDDVPWYVQSRMSEVNSERRSYFTLPWEGNVILTISSR